MPEIDVPESFKEMVQTLPPEIRKKLEKTIRFLGDNPRHPSLHGNLVDSKPVEGATGIYEARVDRSYRLTFERLPGDVLGLRVVGKHDEVLKNP
jgi:mRNA-degrading endonuclease RelE of RelBE toxin-antitoxin system